MFCVFAGLAACQPVPQPFSHAETGNPAILDLPDSGGIVVSAVAEAPAATSTALARAMAAALAEKNIPAGTGTGNQKSHFLHGSVIDDGKDTVIVWTLYGPQGNVVDSLSQSIEGIPVEQWVGAEPNLMRQIARQTAPAIAAHVQGDVPDENIVPALHVAEVTGAPGLGNRQLRSALQRHLAAAGLQLTETPGADKLTVVGTVIVSPVERGQQQATLEWRVLDDKSVEVGKIAQSNPVAAGRLEGSWGAIADIAARGAAEGISGLVRRINWTNAASNDPRPGGNTTDSARTPR